MWPKNLCRSQVSVCWGGKSLKKMQRSAGVKHYRSQSSITHMKVLLVITWLWIVAVLLKHAAWHVLLHEPIIQCPLYFTITTCIDLNDFSAKKASPVGFGSVSRVMRGTDFLHHSSALIELKIQADSFSSGLRFYSCYRSSNAFILIIYQVCALLIPQYSIHVFINCLFFCRLTTNIFLFFCLHTYYNFLIRMFMCM